MAPRTLAAFIKARMALLKTDTVQIERDYPNVPADWIRGLLAGRGTKQPNRERIKGLAAALGVEEVELWRYLGRFDRIADLKGESAPGDMPEWARRIERKLDGLTLLAPSGQSREQRAEVLVAQIAALQAELEELHQGGVAESPAQPARLRKTHG